MPDDLSYARKLAARHGIHLHEVEIAPDVADLLPRLVHSLDEPIGDAAAINAYLICQAARDAGVKVLLSGMGADELFGGYRKHYANLLASRYRRLPGVLRHRVVTPAVQRLPVAGRRRGYRSVRWAQWERRASSRRRRDTASRLCSPTESRDSSTRARRRRR